MSTSQIVSNRRKTIHSSQKKRYNTYPHITLLPRNSVRQSWRQSYPIQRTSSGKCKVRVLGIEEGCEEVTEHSPFVRIKLICNI